LLLQDYSVLLWGELKKGGDMNISDKIKKNGLTIEELAIETGTSVEVIKAYPYSLGPIRAISLQDRLKKIPTYRAWLEKQEYHYFKNLMDLTNGNQSKVAILAKINRGTASKKLKLHGFIGK